MGVSGFLNFRPWKQLLIRSTEASERAPVAEAFANTFPSFFGRSEEDVAKFVSKGEKVTLETTENAAKWKQNAIDAGHEAEYAINASKRSLYIRRTAADDQDFWRAEHEKADAEAKRAMKLKREAESHAETASEAHDNFIDALKYRSNMAEEVKRAEEDFTNAQFIANKLKRDAEAAMEEASESYAIVAYALRARTSSSENLESLIKRDQFNAEKAMGKERQAKRESFFASKAARKREAIHEQALKLQAEF